MNAKSIEKSLRTQTDWVKLHQKDDTDIKHSDSPATNKEFWKDAHIQVFMPQHKVHLSLRLDEAIVNFFKQQGKGYQLNKLAV